MLILFLSAIKRSFLQYRQQRWRFAKIGPITNICQTVSFAFHENVTIGNYVRIGSRSRIDGEGGISIGDGTIMAPNVTVLSSSHRYRDAPCLPYGIEEDHGYVSIGRGAWIGYGAMIRPGVEIGDGAIVALGSVVTKPVAIGEIVGGNPAKTIGQRDANEISRLIGADAYFTKWLHTGRLHRGQRGILKPRE